MPRSGGGENVEKSKDERSKLKVTARQRSIDFSPYGRRPSVHIQLLATLIENLFLMFSLRYGQDDKYRENSSSTPGGEVSRSDGGEDVEKSKDERSKLKVTARQRSFTSCYSLRSSKTFLIFTLRNGQDDKYRENSSSTPGGEVSRSDGGEEHGNVTASNALFIKNRPPYFFIITDFTIFIKNIPYYIILLTINICYEKNYVIDVVCCGNAVGQL